MIGTSMVGKRTGGLTALYPVLVFCPQVSLTPEISI